MSWSVSIVGKPDAIIADLARYSQTQSGQSKIEFDAALPSLVALCKENFAQHDASPHYRDPVLKLTTSGHGSADGQGKQLSRQCSVSIEWFNSTIV